MGTEFKKHDMGFLGGRRLRRMRQSGWSRAIISENMLTPGDLIYPIFITEGENVRAPIGSMPGIFRLSIDMAIKEAQMAQEAGITMLALFPNTQNERRSADGAEALNPDNLTCRALRAIKDKAPDIGLCTDVALDPYTDHGHDGVMDGEEILNDETVEILVGQALNQARAGSSVIAPSDMMDGRIGAIRAALDKNGFSNVIIMAYSAKYASAFYGPFRDAIGSGGRLKGDKRTYQMDYANVNEALREVE
ncbi:Porphobilinogen synthase, partial [hydrothermal vent metagenome]